MRTFIALVFLCASVFAQEENLRPGLVKTWFRDSSTVLVPVPAGKRLGGNFVGAFGGTISSPYTTAIKFWNTSNVYWGDTVKTAYGIPSGTSGQWGRFTRNPTAPQSGTLLPATNTDTSFVNYLKSTGYISFTSAIGTAADVWIRRVNPGRVVLGTTATDSGGILTANLIAPSGATLNQTGHLRMSGANLQYYDGSSYVSVPSALTGSAGGWTYFTKRIYQTTAGDSIFIRTAAGDTTVVGGALFNVIGTAYVSGTLKVVDVWFRRGNPGRMILGTTATDSAGVLSLGGIHGYGKSTFDSLSVLGASRFTGNVGIGTTSGEKLGIGGNVMLKAGADAFLSTGDAYNLLLQGANTAGSLGKGIKIQYYNGSSWFDALGITNVASGYGKLLLMKDGGNVGIRTTAPLTTADITGTLRSTDTLRVGDWTVGSWIKPGDANWTVVSDSTLKTNIRTYTANLANFSRVSPRVFNFKENLFYRNFDYSTLPDSLTQTQKDSTVRAFYANDRYHARALAQVEHKGFIAQEFNGLIMGTTAKTIDYSEITAVLWLKVQELEARIKRGGL